jgi:hypothetical protein
MQILEALGVVTSKRRWNPGPGSGLAAGAPSLKDVLETGSPAGSINQREVKNAIFRETGEDEAL